MPHFMVIVKRPSRPGFKHMAFIFAKQISTYGESNHGIYKIS